LATAPLSVAGTALVIAFWRPLPTDRRGDLLATIGLATAASAAHLVGYDPFFDPACSRTCQASPAALSDALGPGHALGVSAVLTVAASIAAVVTILRSRAALPSLRAAGVVAVVLFAVAALVPWLRWGSPGNPAVEDLLQSLGTAAIVATAFTAVVHTRSVRRDVRDVVEHLGGSTTIGGAGASVTAVQFAIPNDGRWVDTAGHVVSSEEPQRTAVLSDRDGPSVRLVLGRWAEPGQVLSSITPAGLLALENARLQAAAAVRLADVRASQRRIVEATDRVRRRIEHDLHDGAQQRLVAVTMHLSSARKRSGVQTSETLAEAEADVRDALAALRDLSHDSFVATLGAEGLEAAIAELVATTPLRVDVHLALTDRQLPPPVQVAAYLTVAAGLDDVVKRALTDRAWVTVVEEKDVLIVRVVDDGQAGRVSGRGLTDAADRVGALGGSLDIGSGPGQWTTVTARLPCVS
jgi:signal transduction histidine kinase